MAMANILQVTRLMGKYSTRGSSMKTIGKTQILMVMMVRLKIRGRKKELKFGF